MRIASIRHAAPSLCVTNQDLLDELRARNQGHLSPTQLDTLEERARAFLESSGAETRFRRDRGEKSIDFVVDAARRALAAADSDPQEIDFVIYVGVGRGWLEPAMADLIQSELQLTNATGFDVVEACASWLRALQIAHCYINSKAYRQGLIVNCECNLREFQDLEVNCLDQWERRMAILTIGEAATATVVRESPDEDDFYFTFKTFGEHVQTCMIPLENVGEFLPDIDVQEYRPHRFLAQSSQLVKLAVQKSVSVYRDDQILMESEYDVIFSHAVGAPVFLVGKSLDLPFDRYVNSYPRFGNTVSASVPLAMSLALNENRLKTGDRVLVIVPSAGFTVGFAKFTF